MIEWVTCYGTKEKPHSKHIYHSGIKHCMICNKVDYGFETRYK